MAKLLTEEEHAALVADRERLDFHIERRTVWYPGYAASQWTQGKELGTLVYDLHGERAQVEAPTMREAIDKARGVVK